MDVLYSAAILILFRYSMGDQQERNTIGPSNGLPPLLSVLNPVLLHHMKRISEDTNCRVEVHAMLATVGARLLVTPSKSQICHVFNVTTLT